MSDASSSADLIPVRVIDLREPRRSSSLPADRHYPSPRNLRILLGFVIDLSLHLGLSLGTALAAKALDVDGLVVLWLFVGGFLGLSLLHRVVIQWRWQTTVGKWVTGLRLVRADTGGRPTRWQLVRAWWRGLWRSLAAPFSLP